MGTEKKRVGGNYITLASQLRLEANAILIKIDQYLLCDCDFKFSVKLDRIKLQISTVSNTLAACHENKESRALLKSELNNLDASIQNLINEIHSIQPDQSKECDAILNNILNSLNQLRSCIATIVARM